MAEFLSPGVFIEEVPSAVQVIQAVSTSTLGAIGFTPKGPTDEATYITSTDQFFKKFGNLTRNSFLGYSILAFFANGGRRCYIVRVMPSDAVLADLDIQSRQYDQQIETGTGAVTAFSKTDVTTTLKVNDGDTPIIGKNATVAATFGIRWREAGTPVAAERIKDRAGTANVLLVSGTADYEGRIDPAGSISGPLAEGDWKQLVAVPGTVVVNWDPDGTPVTASIPAPTSGTVSTFTSAAGSVFVFDHATGRLSVKFATTEIPGVGLDANSFTIDYTPTSTSLAIADDGAGALVDVVTGSLSAPGTIDYNTGAYSFTATTAPHNAAPLLCSYNIAAWNADPVSKGVWANNVQIRVQGSNDYYDVATQSYSRHDVYVLELNTETNTYDVKEVFEAVDMTDSTSAQYFPDVVNELSDYVQIQTPGGDEYPGALDGLAYTTVLGGGDGTATSGTFGGTVGAPLLPAYLTNLGYDVGRRTVAIAYTNTSDETQSIVDDGTGYLTGDVDPAYATSITVGGVTIGPNQIDYDTGVANFKTVDSPKAGTLVQASFYTTPAETTHTEQFGDTTKQFTDSLAVVHYLAGSDGTFTAGTYSRAQFTDPTLQASKSGLYALDRVDDILQVIVPDFAGDVTVTGDLVDYAESRSNLPSGGDRFIILTVPKGSDPQEAVDWLRYDFGRYTKWAALYWPWIKIADSLANGRPLLLPPMGHIAGIYARTDNNKNVGKAPGGTVDGALQFLLGLEYISTQGDRDLVYPNKINPLIDSPQTGKCVWGIRTISQDSSWRYVHTRRLFMFLEKSVYNSTAWIVFENNGPGLWARIKGQLDGFMNGLFNSGYFYGTSPNQAYFVTVDATNNDASSIEAGQVIVDVGAAANKPAEFVRFRFQQMTLQA